MVKDAYDMFFKNISMQFHDDSLVNALVEDDEELEGVSKIFAELLEDIDIE